MDKDFDSKVFVPRLSLAPMQDVTDLAFWRLMELYGGPDIYFTEYFRVTPHYNLSGTILKGIKNNDTGKPVIAQLIGNDIPSLCRCAKELQKHNVMGIDLNLGCPAPVVFKKRAGGGLLRYPEDVRSIISALRDSVEIQLSVKTRIGFDTDENFDEFLNIFQNSGIDLLTIHGRTVKDMYRSSVNYDWIKKASESLSIPVWANGNIYSHEKAHRVYKHTNAAGLMVGRGAIRNPWIFAQIRQHFTGEPVFIPSGKHIYEYIHRLQEAVSDSRKPDKVIVQHLKKYMNFIGLGIEPQDQFLHLIRRCDNLENFFAICERFLDHDKPMNLIPFAPDNLLPQDSLAGCHL